MQMTLNGSISPSSAVHCPHVAVMDVRLQWLGHICALLAFRSDCFTAGVVLVSENCIIEWWLEYGSGERIIYGISTSENCPCAVVLDLAAFSNSLIRPTVRASPGFSAAAVYHLGAPHKEYRPFVQRLEEKVKLSQMLVKFLQHHQTGSYYEMLGYMHSKAEQHGWTFSENQLLEHAQWLTDQVSTCTFIHVFTL